MSDQTEDKDFEEYLQRGSSVSKQYRALEKVEPSVNLDASIVARAEQELRSAEVQRAPRWKRWSVPVALAASTVVAISIVLESGVRHEVTTSSVRTATSAKEEASEPEVQLPSEMPMADQSGMEAPEAPQERETLVHVDTTPRAPVPESEVMLDEDASTLEPSLAKKAENRAEQAPIVPAETRVEAQDNYSAASSEGSSGSEPTSVTSVRPAAPPPTPITTTAASQRSVPPPAAAQAEELKLAQDPEEWLARIRELREIGKQEEADREWIRFEAAFPTYEVSRDDVARPKD